MKKFLMLVAVLLLLSAPTIKAQSHYTVWQEAKAVAYIGECEEVHDVNVILNTDSESEVEFSIKKDNNEWTLCLPVDTILNTEQCKTTWKFKGKSSMTMFHTGNGDICKFVLKIPNADPYEKIVFLFYM